VQSREVPFTITYNISLPVAIETQNGLKSARLEGAIVDFALPAANLEDPLKRAGIGGKELINLVELTYDQANDRTAVVFRFATAGQGEGIGNIGVALATGFMLPGDVLAALSRSDLTPLDGETVLGNACGLAETAAGKDLEQIGVKATSYTGLLSGSMEGCSWFYGLVLFTNVSSPDEPYFEMYEGQGSQEWNLTALAAAR
jgi:hypothetical protein